MQENTQSENTLAQQLAAPASNLNESRDEKLWQSVGVTTPLGEVRDLWQRKDLGVFHTGFSAEVPPHETVVIK